MLTRPTINEIYDRIKADLESRVTDGVKIPRVSLLGLTNVVFSGSIYLLYGFVQWVAKQLFVDTADGEGLARWGNILGLPRKAATYTSGVVSFTGTAAHVVPTGTLFQNSDGLEYETQADFTIGTTASVAAEAVAAGASYNSEDSTMELSSPDPDIDTDVTVVSGFDDGTDQETEANWIIRLLQRFQNPPASGTTGDYERWALSIDGVGKAWCYGGSDYAGAGTVGVYLSDAELQPVSAGIKSSVETYIDTVKPIPAEVSVVDVNPWDTDYYISISPNTAAIQAEIESQLSDLHLSEAEPGGTLLLSQIRSAIAASAVTDYEITDIDLNSSSIGVVNVTTTKPNIAVYNSVTFASL